MLVVYSQKNQFDAIFDIGQSKDHELLCKGSGIDKIIAAVNKMDLVGWSK